METKFLPTKRELMECRARVLSAIGERKLEPTPGLMEELATWNVMLGDVDAVEASAPVCNDETLEAVSRLPKVITWDEAMQGRERDFNRRYYSNVDGEPRFPHEEVK